MGPETLIVIPTVQTLLIDGLLRPRDNGFVFLPYASSLLHFQLLIWKFISTIFRSLFYIKSLDHIRKDLLSAVKKLNLHVEVCSLFRMCI